MKPSLPLQRRQRPARTEAQRPLAIVDREQADRPWQHAGVVDRQSHQTAGVDVRLQQMLGHRAPPKAGEQELQAVRTD